MARGGGTCLGLGLGFGLGYGLGLGLEVGVARGGGTWSRSAAFSKSAGGCAIIVIPGQG